MSCALVCVNCLFLLVCLFCCTHFVFVGSTTLSYNSDGVTAWTYQLSCSYDTSLPCSEAAKANFTDEQFGDNYFEIGDEDGNNETRLELTYQFGTAAYDLDGFSIFWTPWAMIPLNVVFEYNDGVSWHSLEYALNTASGVNTEFVGGVDSHFEFMYQLHVLLEWDIAGLTPGGIQIGMSFVTGRLATHEPSVYPTAVPSKSPTLRPTINPSKSPTTRPTTNPTVDPTMSPTSSPTFTGVYAATDRLSIPAAYAWMTNYVYSQHSENIYPLRLRDGMTYANYSLPTTSSSSNRAFKVTAILSWGDIDVRLSFVEDVGDCRTPDITAAEIEYALDWDPITSDSRPPSWFNCSGLWRLQSTARLADWQDTYGRFELYEVDSIGRLWLQWQLEFQWNNSECMVDASTNCSYLPMTGTNENTAYFDFTMPKYFGDARVAPFIAVWYDILGVGYAVQPALGDSYQNLTIAPSAVLSTLTVDNAVLQLQGPLIAVALLFGLFAAMLCISCALAGDRKGRKDYMIDTRNLRSTFIHLQQTIIAPPDELRSRARFDCRRHGLWMFVVLFARLIYMFVFTLSMFALIFMFINNDSFSMLNTYDAMATQRNAQLIQLSQDIETWYNNETDRLENAVAFRQRECLDAFVNLTDREWVAGAQAQYEAHSAQMEVPLSFVTVNINSSNELFLVSDLNPCNTQAGSGVIIITSDPFSSISYYPNGTFKNQTYVYAESFDTAWANFSELVQYLTDTCTSIDYCKGWSFTNADASTNKSAAYHLLAETGDPKYDESQSGICMAYLEIDYSLFALTSSLSLDFFRNYSTSLETEYLQSYEADVSQMFEQMSGIWSALQSMDEGSGTKNHNFTVLMNNDPTAEKYDMSVDLDTMRFVGGSAGGQTSLDVTSNWFIIVDCPGCPEGNFTAPQLQELYDNLFSYNSTNLSSYFNSTPNVNISNLLDINTDLFDLPDLPQISIPLVFDLPIDLSWILGIGLTIDVVLFIYRWYKTAGIVARIYRGKDVEIALAHLRVGNLKRPRCCTGRHCCDCLLNGCLCCHDFIRRLSYNLWKIFYWLWYLFRIFLLGVVIYVVYQLIDQIIAVKFFESMGAFNLMSLALGAQRILRNQVLSTSALAYNKITLAAVGRGMAAQAESRNADALQRNEDELDRVEEWNFYFSRVWQQYHGSDREIVVGSTSAITVWASGGTGAGAGAYTLDANVDAVALGSSNARSQQPEAAHWMPFPITSEWLLLAADNVSVHVEYELPAIYMTPALNVYWTLSQIQFKWNWNANNTNGVSPGDSTAFWFETLAENETAWRVHASDAYKYYAKSYGVANELQSFNVDWLNVTNTQRFRVTLLDAGRWMNAFSLASIALYGHSPLARIQVPLVSFEYWSYDASAYQSQLLYCPRLTPVFGIMYRGFVRSWINDQLLLLHEPYILAIRHIALSPFYIAFVAIIILFFAYLVSFMMEWILKKVNLYRENPYARVPLVTTNYDNYDPSLHEVKPREDYDFTQNASLVNSIQRLGTIPIPDRDNIEDGITNAPRIPLTADANARGETHGHGETHGQTHGQRTMQPMEVEHDTAADNHNGRGHGHGYGYEEFDAPPAPLPADDAEAEAETEMVEESNSYSEP